MTAIRTDDLTKRFDGDVLAVDSLDLRVREGEVFGFLGPNGAGKSTVINVLLDLVRPTDGTASVLGNDPQEEADGIRRRTGVLPEGTSLYDRLTGREHVEWIARANDVDEDVEALRKRVGLAPEEIDRPVGGYSKGMAQRLKLALALVGDPELLILDEPSAGLDPAGMQEIREIIRAEAANGRTVFFSSHILGEVEAVCDRIGIMNEGRLVATGSPEALRESLDLGGSIGVEVERVPDELGVEDIDGVAEARVEDSTVVASVMDSTAKVEVVRRLDNRTQVLDIASEDTSLERLFNSYTTGERAADATAEDGSRTPSVEVKA